MCGRESGRPKPSTWTRRRCRKSPASRVGSSARRRCRSWPRPDTGSAPAPETRPPRRRGAGVPQRRAVRRATTEAGIPEVRSSGSTSVASRAIRPVRTRPPTPAGERRAAADCAEPPQDVPSSDRSETGNPGSRRGDHRRARRGGRGRGSARRPERRALAGTSERVGTRAGARQHTCAVAGPAAAPPWPHGGPRPLLLLPLGRLKRLDASAASSRRLSYGRKAADAAPDPRAGAPPACTARRCDRA